MSTLRLLLEERAGQEWNRPDEWWNRHDGRVNRPDEAKNRHDGQLYRPDGATNQHRGKILQAKKSKYQQTLILGL